ncbi:BBE domain-containing protein [Clostridium sporogenes]|uniref:BBE domain-containing protein n=1 Tax=Clostridium sporogenes TaxID=1509 RepID=UPI003DA3A558
MERNILNILLFNIKDLYWACKGSGGGNVQRLKCIKFKYDPLNVFKFPQSIK